MNVYYTAILFSGISFAVTKLLARWKETKQQRIENKQAKIKAEAIKIMSSKELVDSAKKKDEETRILCNFILFSLCVIMKQDKVQWLNFLTLLVK